MTVSFVKIDKVNGVFIIDKKLYNKAIQKVPNDCSCKDTFYFLSQIKNANLSRKFLVSYDITSLFTNIPLQETIDIAISLIFNHNPNLNITKKELKKLFVFATSQTHFIYNSKFITKFME